MTGWRLGWLVVPDAYVDAVTRLAQNLFCRPPPRRNMRRWRHYSGNPAHSGKPAGQEFQRRRDLAAGSICATGHKFPAQPKAHFMYADVSAHRLNNLPGPSRFCRMPMWRAQAAVASAEAARHVHTAPPPLRRACARRQRVSQRVCKTADWRMVKAPRRPGPARAFHQFTRARLLFAGYMGNNHKLWYEYNILCLVRHACLISIAKPHGKASQQIRRQNPAKRSCSNAWPSHSKVVGMFVRGAQRRSQHLLVSWRGGLQPRG